MIEIFWLLNCSLELDWRWLVTREWVRMREFEMRLSIALWIMCQHALSWMCVCVCLYVVHPLSWRWKVFLDIFLLFLVWNIFSYISCKSFSRYTQFWMLSMAHLPRKMDGTKQSTNNIVLFLLLRFLSLFLSSSSSFLCAAIAHSFIQKLPHTKPSYVSLMHIRWMSYRQDAN